MYNFKFRFSWGNQPKEYPSAVSKNDPYILDPANAFNNLYLSGAARYDPGKHASEYGEGNGNWYPFAKKVHSLDLLTACPKVE